MKVGPRSPRNHCEYNCKEVQIGDVGAQAAAHADGERMALNVGPSHPTTHGVLRLLMELDGDLITRNVSLFLVIYIVEMKKLPRI